MLLKLCQSWFNAVYMWHGYLISSRIKRGWWSLPYLYLSVSFSTQFHWPKRQRNSSFLAIISLLVILSCPSSLSWLEKHHKYSELLSCLQSSPNNRERGLWRWESGNSPVLIRDTKEDVLVRVLSLFQEPWLLCYLLSSQTLQLPVPLAATQADTEEERGEFCFFTCLEVKGGFLGNGIIYF